MGNGVHLDTPERLGDILNIQEGAQWEEVQPIIQGKGYTQTTTAMEKSFKWYLIS